MPLSVRGSNALRPASVPADYVITPFGYFHSSCVLKLTKGERLLPDGRVQHMNGTTNVSPVFCNYPRYASNGLPLGTSAAILPEVNGWIENANITTDTPTVSYAALIATWTVPPQPKANDGQWLFFFPGLEDINDPQTSILQPVLQWAFGQWAIASWNCCLNNIAVESPVVNVSPGDLIYGSITNTCPPGTISCATWNVLSVDLTTGDSTILSQTPSDGQVFNWAFGAVLEPYYVVSCKDYPPDRRIGFYDITVFDEFLNPIRNPPWSTSVNSTQEPQCGYGAETRRREVTLEY